MDNRRDKAQRSRNQSRDASRRVATPDGSRGIYPPGFDAGKMCRVSDTGIPAYVVPHARKPVAGFLRRCATVCARRSLRGDESPGYPPWSLRDRTGLALRLLPGLLLLFLLCGGAHAHVVQQIFVEFKPGADTWQAEVTMDAGYAWPPGRNDPGLPQPTLAWLQARSPEVFEILRSESELLLRQHLEFSGGGRPLAWTCRFPDFDSSPPNFPKLPGRFAFMRVLITGPAPADGAPLIVRELTGNPPSFIFKTGEESFLTLAPGQSVTLTHALEGEAGSPTFPHFFAQGFLHVLPLGWDHILFILAMFLLDRRLRPVLWQSLAFTAAHTVTLGLVMFNVVQPAPRIVEPLIALSIAAAAAENLFASRIKPHRLALIFGFGLVHGLGFGGALSAVLQSSGGVAPLLAANIGVECAQVVILAAAALVFYFLAGDLIRTRSARVINVLLVITGLALMVQRLTGG